MTTFSKEKVSFLGWPVERIRNTHELAQAGKLYTKWTSIIFDEHIFEQKSFVLRVTNRMNSRYSRACSMGTILHKINFSHLRWTNFRTRKFGSEVGHQDILEITKNLRKGEKFTQNEFQSSLMNTFSNKKVSCWRWPPGQIRDIQDLAI